MAIGYRIKQIRNLRGLTQKDLGIAVGFSERTADIRIAQYEAGTRNPQDKITKAIANALNVSTISLKVPEVDSYYGIMHTLFSLEDAMGLMVTEVNGRMCLQFSNDGFEGRFINEYLAQWYEEYLKLFNDDISIEEYNEWRYTFPESSAKKTRKQLDKLREKDSEN